MEGASRCGRRRLLLEAVSVSLLSSLSMLSCAITVCSQLRTGGNVRQEVVFFLIYIIRI